MTSNLSTVTDDALIELTTSIVGAYVSNNAVQPDQVPSLIASVHKSLKGLAGSGAAASAPSEPLVPAVPVRKSIQHDHIVCLEDGMKFKSLKRHIMSKYSLTPEQYRLKWSLPDDYPMVAPAYSQARSALAKQMGLGKVGSRRAA